jgi:DNA-binding transcriptional regulator YiaG
MNNKDLSKTVREIRAALGLTQKQFAAKIGVAYSTVNRWGNNRRKPCALAMGQLEKLQKEMNRNK